MPTKSKKAKGKKLEWVRYARGAQGPMEYGVYLRYCAGLPVEAVQISGSYTRIVEGSEEIQSSIGGLPGPINCLTPAHFRIEEAVYYFGPVTLPNNYELDYEFLKTLIFPKSLYNSSVQDDMQRLAKEEREGIEPSHRKLERLQKAIKENKLAHWLLGDID